MSAGAKKWTWLVVVSGIIGLAAAMGFVMPYDALSEEKAEKTYMRKDLAQEQHRRIESKLDLIYDKVK